MTLEQISVEASRLIRFFNKSKQSQFPKSDSDGDPKIMANLEDCVRSAIRIASSIVPVRAIRGSGVGSLGQRSRIGGWIPQPTLDDTETYVPSETSRLSEAPTPAGGSPQQKDSLRKVSLEITSWLELAEQFPFDKEVREALSAACGRKGDIDFEIGIWEGLLAKDPSNRELDEKLRVAYRRKVVKDYGLAVRVGSRSMRRIDKSKSETAQAKDTTDLVTLPKWEKGEREKDTANPTGMRAKMEGYYSDSLSRN